MAAALVSGLAFYAVIVLKSLISILCLFWPIQLQQRIEIPEARAGKYSVRSGMRNSRSQSL